MDPSQIWLMKSQEDFETAMYNLDGNKLSYAAFLFQQATEKALKAVLIKKGNAVPKIHDCGVLARQTQAPENIIKQADSLTKYYFQTRYPDKGFLQINYLKLKELKLRKRRCSNGAKNFVKESQECTFKEM